MLSYTAGSSLLMLMSMPGGGEWLWILLVVVLFFGARKLPALAKGLGQSVRNFRDEKDRGGAGDKQKDTPIV